MIIHKDNGDYFELKEVEGKTVVKMYKKSDNVYEIELTLTFNSEKEALKALDSFDSFEDLI